MTFKPLFYHCAPQGGLVCAWTPQRYPSLLQFATSGMGFLSTTRLHLSYPLLGGPSIICCTEAVQSALSSSLGGVDLYVCVDPMCPWEEVSSESSYTAILGWKPLILFSDFPVSSPLTHRLFYCVLFKFHILVKFLVFLLLLISRFIQWWSENMLHMILFYLNLLRLILWPNTRSWRMVHAHLRISVFCCCWVK